MSWSDGAGEGVGGMPGTNFIAEHLLSFELLADFVLSLTPIFKIKQ